MGVLHSNTGYVAMRGCGQKRLVEAAGGLKAFMPLHTVLSAGVCYLCALALSPVADNYRRWYGSMQDTLFNFFPAPIPYNAHFAQGRGV